MNLPHNQAEQDGFKVKLWIALAHLEAEINSFFFWFGYLILEVSLFGTLKSIRVKSGQQDLL
jgi:hypothetical protein